MRPQLLGWSLVFVLTALTAAFGQSETPERSWELRVCADPKAYPVSSESLDGYENRVAAILADELGARLTYEWTLISDATVQLLLKQGACDLIMSAGEGAQGLLNTVAYQRIANVFLYLTDSGFAAESLYDPALSELRIATMPNTSMNAVLFDLGLADNYVGIQPNASKRGFERIQPTVDALLAGEVDVAIVSGALASAYVRDQPEVFAMTPVQPELVPPLTPTFYLGTIGVRPRDEGLRDALNVALARRWEDVQQVFADLGVPTLPNPGVLVNERPDELLQVGVIAPFPTGFAAELDVLAESAYFGARLADDLALRREDRAGVQLHLVYASAPSTAAALRAFDRLNAWDEVEAVVVAHDDETTRALAERAGEHGDVLLNALAAAVDLRSRACYPSVYHVAPSNDLYAAALARQAIDSEADSVLIVTDGSPDAERRASVVEDGLSDAEVSSSTLQVAAGLVFPYADVLAVTESSADAVVVLLPPDAQGLFLAELDRESYDGKVLGFPWPQMQSRQFYYRLIQDSPDVLGAPRIAGWDASLVEDGADDLNLRFSSRSAMAMDVTAWSTYAAVELAIEAAVTADREGVATREALPDAVQRASLHKGPDVAVDPSTNQLMQPLYQVALNPDGRWSAAVSERVALAEVVGTIPVADLAVPGASGGCD